MRKIFVNLVVVFFFLLTACIAAFMIMVCWNFSISKYFELKNMTFLQSLGLYTMLRIILDNPLRIEASEISSNNE